MAFQEEMQAFPEAPAGESRVWDILSQVMDPEIPALNVIEMGIIRRVELEPSGVTVTITPTYSGCPAMDMISREIDQALRQAGFVQIKIKTTYAPPWTSDWLTSEARRKLVESGIAPPPPVGAPGDLPVACPYCGATKTELRSFFGCTACKSMHFCNACRQPFESFKSI